MFSLTAFYNTFMNVQEMGSIKAFRLTCCIFLQLNTSQGVSDGGTLCPLLFFRIITGLGWSERAYGSKKLRFKLIVENNISIVFIMTIVENWLTEWLINFINCHVFSPVYKTTHQSLVSAFLCYCSSESHVFVIYHLCNCASASNLVEGCGFIGGHKSHSCLGSKTRFLAIWATLTDCRFVMFSVFWMSEWKLQ